MNICITPQKLSGAVTPPASKSMAHRAVLAMALAGGTGTLSNLSDSQDIQATKRCVEALKAPRPDEALPFLDCGESGSTLRFLIPIALAAAGGGVFTGHGRLMERPQQPYFDIFDEKGIFYEQKDGILTVRGTLTPGVYRLPGNVSSQFVTGLLYALPLLPGDSSVEITTPLESSGYVDMTLDMLQKFGITVENQHYAVLRVPGNQTYQARDIAVESDWSQAGFWYAAAFLDNHVDIQGLNADSTQGDRVVASLYWKLAKPGDVDIDVSGCPDLLPPLAVMAAARQGTTRFINAARLRIKESDRLSTTAALLNHLGGSAEDGPDSLTVHGVPSFSGGTVDGANDHRIVMAAAIAATHSAAPVTILGAEAVNKSYPSFWEDYKRLGGVFDVL
ncbi:3-phosphoshikimate 1-carboxyvinyltransferase [Oscillibacter sp.]|uniref:3-phosphoshikimate 1-carboxyvinyltransferase n=1 Tax=Oscillibacter sp. TaxID=1945593 RepID=UPI001B60528F|nr:3-phosphoshikimate 1-carboxyvinyltransferase [Oscillibacter sp.]MBP3509067.1 3-phosphoshikimate 1-carboxyvinyltransferase [Oscillibacter sp.]